MTAKKFLIPMLLTATFTLNSCGDKVLDINHNPTTTETIEYPDDQKFKIDGKTYSFFFFFSNVLFEDDGRNCYYFEQGFYINERGVYSSGSGFGSMNPDHIARIYDIRNQIAAKLGLEPIENPFAVKKQNQMPSNDVETIADLIPVRHY